MLPSQRELEQEGESKRESTEPPPPGLPGFPPAGMPGAS